MGAVSCVCVVAGCATGTQDKGLSSHDLYGEPTSSSDASPTAQAQRSPFDAYFLTDEQQDVVDRAIGTLAARCMKDRGFTYHPMPETHDMESAALPDGWGPGSLEEAEALLDDNHSDAPAGEQDDTSDPGYIQALVNPDNTGCQDLAEAEIGYDSDWFSVISTYEDARRRSVEAAMNSAETTKLIGAWSSCFQEDGHQAQAPADLYVDASGQPTMPSRDIVLADARCKEHTHFAEAYSRIEADFADKEIAHDRPTMEQVKERSGRILAQAQDILAQDN